MSGRIEDENCVVSDSNTLARASPWSTILSPAAHESFAHHKTPFLRSQSRPKQKIQTLTYVQHSLKRMHDLVSVHHTGETFVDLHEIGKSSCSFLSCWRTRSNFGLIMVDHLVNVLHAGALSVRFFLSSQLEEHTHTR